MKTFTLTSLQLGMLLVDANFSEPSNVSILKEIGVIIPARNAAIDQIFNQDNTDYAFFQMKATEEDPNETIIYFMPDEEEDDTFCVWHAGAWHDSDPDPILEGQTWPELKSWLELNCY